MGARIEVACRDAMHGEGGDVRVLVYVSISYVCSEYIISASVGLRVVSSAVAFP